MGPEFSGYGPQFGKPADIWNLGCVLLFIAAGEETFKRWSQDKGQDKIRNFATSVREEYRYLTPLLDSIFRLEPKSRPEAGDISSHVLAQQELSLLELQQHWESENKGGEWKFPVGQMETRLGFFERHCKRGYWEKLGKRYVLSSDEESAKSLWEFLLKMDPNNEIWSNSLKSRKKKTFQTLLREFRIAATQHLLQDWKWDDRDYNNDRDDGFAVVGIGLGSMGGF
jgi:serine/threonine protein kinase